MHKFEKFLAFYSTIAILVLIFGSLSFLPRPHNYVMLSIFLPICVYFWLRVTAPEGTNASKWSLRLLLLLVLLSGLGMFGYYLAGNKTFNETSESENISLKEEIGSLKKDLADIKGSLNITPTATKSGSLTSDNETSIADVLGDTDKPIEDNILGYIAKMPANGTVDIYKEDSSSSEVISQMKENTNYPFYDKNGNYYLIGLGENTFGYVKVNLVKQVVVSP